ncbi:cache domain-containing protein [Nitratidesulfovibrio sp.]|uniref:methyl-accepting chemotaxis protein n=1 Tax=Nitratidesulfovibrio sp. TaxID=2802297 RepID=UPI003342C4E9
MRRSVIIRLLFIVVIGLVVEGGAFLGYVSFDLTRFARKQADQTRGTIYEHEKYSLRDMVDSAYSIVAKYHAQSQDVEALKQLKVRELKLVVDSAVSMAQAQIAAAPADRRAQAAREMLSVLRGLRFDGGNYVWVNDLDTVVLMHPVSPQLEGKGQHSLRDAHGKAMFDEFVAVARGKGEGMVDYMWPKPGQTNAQVKVSYVKLVPELGWVIGAGAYLDDMTEELKREALEQIGRIRLSDGNYFWVNDLAPRMVMHPVRPELDGTNLAQTVDAEGKHFFVEMAEVAKTQGEGTVAYRFEKPGKSGVHPKLSYVKAFKPWGWVIGMGVYMDEVDAQIVAEQSRFNAAIHDLMGRSGVIGLFIAVGMVGLVVLYIQRRLRQPLGQVVDYAGRIASGDLDASITGRFRGEMLQLADALHVMVTSLKERMEEARLKGQQAAEEAARARAATAEAEEARRRAEHAKAEGMLAAAGILDTIVSSLTEASRQVADLSAEISTGADGQQHRITETATAMEEMNATILEVAGNSGRAAENADHAKGRAQEGADTANASVAAIEEVQHLAVTLKANVAELGAKAEAIGQIMNVINDIADQTNLLALNAAIEAARAGEAGRGFAVVADEVRKLAEKTMSATKEVGDAIGAIQQATRENTRSVENAVTAVDKATDLVVRSGEALREIVVLSEQSADRVRSIATAAEEQSAASEEITRALDEIHALSGRITGGIGQAADAQQALNLQCVKLADLIENIKRENG